MLRELFVWVTGWIAALVDRIGSWYIWRGIGDQMNAPDGFFV